MAIHCMLLTGDNIRIVQNFLSEFKDKYDCMQTFDMVRSMISAWQSANFKDGEEPTMPTKDEIEKFIQSQLSKDKQSSVAPIQEDNKSYAEDLARCARQMSPIERKHRVERITRMFSSIVNSKLKDKLAAYNDKIQAETNPKVKNDLLFGR